MKAARLSDARRARTLAVALAFLLGGTALYVKSVQAASCGARSGFVAGAGALPAPVRPADCVLVTFADGRREARSTDVNWSQPRTFTVDSTAAAIAPADHDLHNAAASSTTYPRDSLGSPTLTVTAPASGREIVPAPARGAAPTVTAWTSPGVAPSTRLY